MNISELTRKRPYEDSDEELFEKPKTYAPAMTKPEPSIFGITPNQDLLRVLSDFIIKHMSSPGLEIEAKLGTLIDKNTKKRITLPVMCETVLMQDQSWLRFESCMTLKQHAHFNHILNQRTQETNKPRYTGHKILYKHTKEVDRFYTGESEKVRVTTDKETSQVLSLSVPQGDPMMERQKDRVSYKHEIFSFDLTQVTVPAEKPRINPYATGPPPKTPEPKLIHELEIEIADPKRLFDEKNLFIKNSNNHFNDMVQSFLNNMKVLAKSAPPP
ncbi:mRNA-capping enzyme subunit beta [Mycoemilia scoparia]|uniref:mRNA-capping enzyme subunit beta n=1 Tax=Mycoemilia scoparia TaxID=417184 RepID=A0A9W8A3M8_9FUNG|nr:mRNA-capping enzyme subunit beta [Mycoemilia scoparia]